MLEDLNLALKMHDEGNFPLHSLVRWVVKEAAEHGSAQDIMELPDWLRGAVAERLEQFKKERVWTSFSGEGGEEDIAPYAQALISKLTAP